MDADKREKPAKPWPFQGFVYWASILAWAAILVFLWLVRRGGPDHPFYVLIFLGWTWLLAPGVAAPGLRILPRRWFHVPAWERSLHRWLGVGVFGRLLDVSGWNRHCAKPMRGFTGKRDGLAHLEQSVRAGEIAHGSSFLMHAAAAGIAYFTGHSWAARWILLSGVPTHLYPALLQRSLLLRLQPLRISEGPHRTRSGS